MNEQHWAERQVSFVRISSRATVPRLGSLINLGGSSWLSGGES